MKIISIDIDNFLDTSIFDKIATSNGISITKPQNKKELIAEINQANKQETIILVFYYNFNQLKWIIPLLIKARNSGITVINSPATIKKLINYPERSYILKSLGYKIPNFFYGNSSAIPQKIGEKIVWKSLTQNLAISCERNNIHCMNEDIYVESCIPNPDKHILTIYNIAGCVYARWKEDPLQTKCKTRNLINNLEPFKHQIEITKKITQDFNLIFCNVEFINDYIIDVNAIANIFYPDHLDPIESLISYILKIN